MIELSYLLAVALARQEAPAELQALIAAVGAVSDISALYKETPQKREALLLKRGARKVKGRDYDLFVDVSILRGQEREIICEALKELRDVRLESDGTIRYDALPPSLKRLVGSEVSTAKMKNGSVPVRADLRVGFLPARLARVSSGGKTEFLRMTADLPKADQFYESLSKSGSTSLTNTNSGPELPLLWPGTESVQSSLQASYFGPFVSQERRADCWQTFGQFLLEYETEWEARRKMVKEEAVTHLLAQLKGTLPEVYSGESGLSGSSGLAAARFLLRDQLASRKLDPAAIDAYLADFRVESVAVGLYLVFSPGPNSSLAHHLLP
ncbi:MAG: hypothetical protein KIT11_00835 [Fimbriimonadaceae bacterium]|nr:hypothetical protein [Fimbriimonadaceae bacterium]QYK55081.1 MAG: hypothetical protein KF733_08700 [Fimbriimonadaceae bacterium]